MKKILTLLAVTIACSINAQVQYVQTNNTGSTSASAIGYYTIASGDGTLATGRDSKAIGDWSTAMGYKSEAMIIILLQWGIVARQTDILL